MKSFLDNRSAIQSFSAKGAKTPAGAGFQKMQGSGGAKSQQEQAMEEVANPNDPDAPKVEFVRNGEVIEKIVVSFGEKKVEIDCQY